MRCTNLRPRWGLVSLMIAGVLTSCDAGPSDLESMPVVPSPEQVAYQRQEFIGFIHFSLNTFTDKEWGYGDEAPELFDPSDLDVRQWARTAASVGMKELVLTTKHHDGFTLWPSEHTKHSVAASPWMSGEGDLVRDFVEAARWAELKVGFYLSPWDRNQAEYGTPAYVDYYRAQLRELLTEYGDVAEVWFDGANGGDGYYGGAREERRIDRFTYYGWEETWNLVRELQPGALMFSDAGPDIRWIGNERGFAPETTWSTIDTEGIVPGEADPAYLGTGEAGGPSWVIPLCDTSIRPGWFYHADQDDQVKSPQELVDLYYRSVGRNCVLLLNMPPDQRGRIHERDVASLREMRRILDETFRENVLRRASSISVPVRGNQGDRSGALPWMVRDRLVDGNSDRWGPHLMLDLDPDTYWTVDDSVRSVTAEFILRDEPTTVDRILLQEPIQLGQRIAAFAVDLRVDGAWREVARGTTVGHKRLLRVEPVEADGLRVRIEESLGTPALSELGLYKASPDEERRALPGREMGGG